MGATTKIWKLEYERNEKEQTHIIVKYKIPKQQMQNIRTARQDKYDKRENKKRKQKK